MSCRIVIRGNSAGRTPSFSEGIVSDDHKRRLVAASARYARLLASRTEFHLGSYPVDKFVSSAVMRTRSAHACLVVARGISMKLTGGPGAWASRLQRLSCEVTGIRADAMRPAFSPCLAYSSPTPNKFSLRGFSTPKLSHIPTCSGNYGQSKGMSSIESPMQ